jgi:hypothetical protein
MRPHRHIALLALVLVALFAAAGSAQAFTPKPDPAAPRGAAPDWLPHEEWVGQRWLPFDEQVLERKLHLSATQVWLYLSSTGNSLNTLAKSRGVATHGLATSLVTRRHVPRKSRLWRTLRARTERVLSQPHLAAHMFGHVFHIWAVTLHTSQTLGVTSQQFQQLYGKQHLSFLQVAAAGGVDEATLRRRVMAAADSSGTRGVAKGAMSASENRILRARDAAGFSSWANYGLPGQQKVTYGFLCHLPTA